ncbi:hypothetical protein PENTCL1PPCAC_29730 [Pristionchus entomophagus]|uniref:TPM domain-containing protein n=1 Tax=Pristionchus entomophagus TaxID=358040 RepID=A0AAV5UKF2_9BILA|nr:hypothetical protein PENTCL1PPCAC_29730 [Pristionchus entomophagus]
MLSLLNLIIASGTVLRSDTERWTPESYPDPRVNFTQCNVAGESFVCDPDHILTDNWRETIDANVKRQIQRLADSPVLYTDSAPPECYSNDTQPVEIFVLLAKRIHTASNQTVNETDMTTFVDGLADSFGLANLTCANFVVLVGVEQANAYVRTGRHLKLPTDFVEGLSKYTSLFNEKTYMEGLNKVIDEIGDQMISFFNPTTTEAVEETTQEIQDSTTEETSEPPPQSDAISTSEVRKVGDRIEIRIPLWVFILVTTLIVLLIILCVGAAFFLHQHGIPRFGERLQRFMGGSENQGYDETSMQSDSTKVSQRLDSSSLQSISPYSPEVDGKKSRISNVTNGNDEGIVANGDQSSSEPRSDNESCELNMTTDESDDDREMITKESIMSKIQVDSSQLSTDAILPIEDRPTTTRSLSLMKSSSLV